MYWKFINFIQTDQIASLLINTKYFTFIICGRPGELNLTKLNQNAAPMVQMIANLTIRSSFMILIRLHLQMNRYRKPIWMVISKTKITTVAFLTK